MPSTMPQGVWPLPRIGAVRLMFCHVILTR